MLNSHKDLLFFLHFSHSKLTKYIEYYQHSHTSRCPLVQELSWFDTRVVLLYRLYKVVFLFVVLSFVFVHYLFLDINICCRYIHGSNHRYQESIYWMQHFYTPLSAGWVIDNTFFFFDSYLKCHYKYLHCFAIVGPDPEGGHMEDWKFNFWLHWDINGKDWAKASDQWELGLVFTCWIDQLIVPELWPSPTLHIKPK